MAFFDSRIDRNRIKLEFGMKITEKNSPDFLFNFALERKTVLLTSSLCSNK